MEKRVLGRTNLLVTQLGFGAMELRGGQFWRGRPITDEESDQVLNAVLDAGINFIDTSRDYGLSEERIGKYIGSRRKEYYLATKCGCFITPEGDHFATSHVWTRDNLLRNIEESLEKLKTDYIDIWQIHNAGVEDVERENLVEVMREVQATGKVKFISISSTLPHLPIYLEMDCFDTFQIPYSALERRHEDLIARVGEAGAGVIIRGGVSKGRISDDHRDQGAIDIWAKAGMDELLNGMSRSEFILRYTLTHPHCHTTIVGTLNPKHLKENVEAADRGSLPADIYVEAKRRLSEAGEKPE